jgi:hypothetical protein
MTSLEMGQIYRYARPYSEVSETVDGLPNFFHRTHSTGKSKPLLDRGISPIASVLVPEGRRVPAILLSSSPHRIGSEGTPWQDIFDVDNGTVRYFGDNKSPSNADLSPGNRILLDEFRKHTSPDASERLKATPILFFEREEFEGRIKGNVRFQGLGLLQRVELVTQYQREIGYFTNYVFEFIILSMAKDGESLNWDWISKRREGSVDLSESIKLAPLAYQDWQKHGGLVVEKHRRRVSALNLVKSVDQLPGKGTREAAALDSIYNYFEGKKHRFEMFANLIVRGLVSDSGAVYTAGWVTRGSSDGGVDFVGRIDIGHGFSKVKVIVLGQAKCEKPTSGTSGRDLARTVARLKRGWIGAYVTTSFFTERSQIEIIEDQYPLITVNGKQLAEEALRQQRLNNHSTLHDFLVFADSEYDFNIRNGRPEEILLHQGEAISPGVPRE